jgi:hypothetical protein
MSRKSRKDASSNYIAVGVSLLALVIMGVAAVLPVWITFPMQPSISWPLRNFGLLKVSGRYTNTLVTPADLTWIEVRDNVCAASAAFVSGMSTTTNLQTAALGAATAIGAAMVGANCKDTCKTHLNLRCTSYYKFTTMNFAVFGMLIGGGVVSLIGSGMPLIGKERKRDRATWLAVDLVGFLLAGGACALHWFIYSSTFNQLRLSGYFPKESLGWCFFMASAGAVLLLVPVVLQLMKVLSGSGDKKSSSEDPNAQLLTAGASPEFMMPSAI